MWQWSHSLAISQSQWFDHSVYPRTQQLFYNRAGLHRRWWRFLCMKSLTSLRERKCCFEGTHACMDLPQLCVDTPQRCANPSMLALVILHVVKLAKWFCQVMKLALINARRTILVAHRFVRCQLPVHEIRAHYFTGQIKKWPATFSIKIYVTLCYNVCWTFNFARRLGLTQNDCNLMQWKPVKLSCLSTIDVKLKN